METVWRPRRTDSPPQSAEAMPECPDLINRLLEVRGFLSHEEKQKILYPKLSDLRDPFLMKSLDLAVGRLVRAFQNQEHVCIYADFDLDGTSGLALLHEGLKTLGFSRLERYQPKRLSEGYGFHGSAVEDLHGRGVSLIVTVDVGITAVETVDRARNLGLDVIVTDHHLPGEQLPRAYAVVNPNQPGDTSGLGYLCGAGVAFYLLRGLCRKLQPLAPEAVAKLDLKSLLDFFSIATLTDMVPLIEDNRVLIKHGLVCISETKRPGLRSLLKALDLEGRSLSAQDVAIRFAPKLNALSRMESGILPIDIFLCEEPAVAEDLVVKVIENNQTRVLLQAQAESLADQMMVQWPENDFIFLASDQFHRGIVGLIATRLAQNDHKPAFVGSIDQADGVVVGSARLPQGSDFCLVEALGAAEQGLNRFGGHSAAAGFELSMKNMDLVIGLLKTYFAELKTQARVRELEYDLDAELADIQPMTMKWHNFMGPFGVGFQPPVFRFQNVFLSEIRELRGGHLRMGFSHQGKKTTIVGLLFSPSDRLREMAMALKEDLGQTKVEILGEIQWNYFQGKQSIQILVRDLKVQQWQ